MLVPPHFLHWTSLYRHWELWGLSFWISRSYDVFLTYCILFSCSCILYCIPDYTVHTYPLCRGSNEPFDFVPRPETVTNAMVQLCLYCFRLFLHYAHSSKLPIMPETVAFLSATLYNVHSNTWRVDVDIKFWECMLTKSFAIGSFIPQIP